MPKEKSNKNKRQHALEYLNIQMDNAEEYDFTAVSLTHSNFRNCVITNISFERAAVTGSIFENCVFKNCNFNGADFEFCQFKSCRFKDQHIKGASFNNSDFIGDKSENSFIQDVFFLECTFTGTFFQCTSLISVELKYCTLEGACFSNTFFKDIDWRELNIEYVEFLNPKMENVVLPYEQIPYTFGLLDYLANNRSINVHLYKSKKICIDTYFKKEIPLLLKKFLHQDLFFPISNIYLFGDPIDYNSAFAYLERELQSLAMVRDYRGIKFCCKLIVMSNKFSHNQLNRFYNAIINSNKILRRNSAEIKSFTRHIGEIRELLFGHKNGLSITLKANINIENSKRFSNLINTLQCIAKPTHEPQIPYVTLLLSNNSPLYIVVNIDGEQAMLLSILKTFLHLTNKEEDCLMLDNEFNERGMIKQILPIERYKKSFDKDQIQLELLEYIYNDDDMVLQNVFSLNRTQLLTTGE